MVYKQLLTFFFSIIIKPFWEMSMIAGKTCCGVEAGSRQTIDSYSPLSDALGPKEASHPLP